MHATCARTRLLKGSISVAGQLCRAKEAVMGLRARARAFLVLHGKLFSTSICRWMDLPVGIPSGDVRQCTQFSKA